MLNAILHSVGKHELRIHFAPSRLHGHRAEEAGDRGQRLLLNRGLAQQGFEHASQEGFELNLMGGREIATATNMASETTIRGMYRYYRQLMDL